VLRAQAFEGLFTLVPILLVAVVSILLRARAARRRKRREEAAQKEGTRSSAATPAAGAGRAPRVAAVRGVPARGTPAQAPGRPIPPQRTGAKTRAAQFPWQRETDETTAGSPAPFTPQQPRRPQVPIRESYAYPPPLSLKDAESLSAGKAGGAQPRAAAIPRPVVRPSAESRMAVERMAAPKAEQNLRERMQARAKMDRPAAKVATEKRYSVTNRLMKLPPLKRAVIWAEILGPPGGRQ
jgi:hypothetical protein